jgi:ketosteroid isomerase-like protein
LPIDVVAEGAVGASERLRIAKAYEAALFAGRMEEVGSYFSDDVEYWIAGDPPIGGTWRGREAVLRAFERREFGLGKADWGYEDLERTWYAADERVIVEIHERSWLQSSPDDVIDQRTCVVIRFRGDRICSMRDYTDAGAYAAFAKRHRGELPKFAGQSPL